MTIILHKSAIALVFEITVPTRRFPARGLPCYGVASGTGMYQLVVIITRAALNAVFESVDVYFEHVGRGMGIGGAVYLEYCLTCGIFNSVYGVQGAAIIDWGWETAGLRRSCI